jgi:hypothetical protein
MSKSETQIKETETTTMTISNKIAMDLAIANMDTATTCPAWLFIILGVMGIALVASIVAVFAINR